MSRQAENPAGNPLASLESWLRGLIRVEIQAAAERKGAHDAPQLFTAKQVAHLWGVPVTKVRPWPGVVNCIRSPSGITCDSGPKTWRNTSSASATASSPTKFFSFFPQKLLIRNHGNETFRIMTGKQLKEIRKRLDWTQAEMAAAVGLTRNTIARQERGELGVQGPLARLVKILDQQKRKGGRN